MSSGGLIETLVELRESVRAEWRTGEVEPQLHLELGAPKLLLLEIAEKAAAVAIVRETAGVQKTYVVAEDVARYRPYSY